MAANNDTRKKPKPKNQTFQERSTTVIKYMEKEVHYPWIRLRGLWLEKAGFTPRTKIRVRVMTDCLVITKVCNPQK